uniref:Uncharacterized protein n=1 Tax=Avena sativa TaxID=4498 RepID=A0ACD5WQU5_AVESA
MNRCPSSPAPATPLDDEDLLREIFLRLPPRPSSLPRASLVCKCWRRILSNQRFLRRFCKHHQKPLLLGFFEKIQDQPPILTPLLDPPDRIPVARFALPHKRSSYNYKSWHFMGGRHGMAVLVHSRRRKILVWDPLTNQHKCVRFPPGLLDDKHYIFWIWHAAVICTDAEDGHVHGDCFSSPFKSVLVWGFGQMQAFSCLYESASGVWEDIVSIPFTDMLYQIGSPILVGNALCWLLREGDVAAFDFQRNNIDVIVKPADAHIAPYRSAQLLRTGDGEFGLAVLSELTIKLWERKSNCDGVVKWLLPHKTIHLDLFPCPMRAMSNQVLIVGYGEESNVIILSTTIGNFMLQLDSTQITHIVKRDTMCYNTFYPYTSFYTAGLREEDSRRSIPSWLNCFGHSKFNGGPERSNQWST